MLLLVAFICHATAVERVSSYADATSLYLGESFVWDVRVQLTDVLGDSPVVLPTFPSEFIEVERGTEIITEDSRRIARHWVELRPIMLGSVTLPAIEVAADDNVSVERTSPLFLEVLPRLSEEQMQAGLRDIKGPSAPSEPVGWLAWALTFALIGLSWIVWSLWRKRARSELVEPEVPPFEAAMAALQALELLAAEGSDLVQARAFALTAIIKRYLEGRYGFNATDMTSEELLRYLRREDGFVSLDMATITPFIEETDAIKYAAAQASVAQANALMVRATDLVVATKPDEDEEC